MPPRAPQLERGFPWKAGAAGAQRSHWVQDPVPKSQRNWMQVRHQPPWEAPAGSPGSPGVSGSLAFAALLQTMPREVPGVEQHLGKDCKQHPNNLCERIHSLGSAQSCNQHPQDVSSLAPALSAWTNHSQRDSVPRSPGSGLSLVGRSSVSCSRSVSSSPSDCRRAGSC